MSLRSEAVIDRRRLKRRLSTWRVIAIIAGAIALMAVMASSGLVGGLGNRDQIARITISGIIQEDRTQLKMLRRLADAEHVKAVLVYVNSGGGTTTGGEALYEALREVSAKKPVVAQFGTVAASAAYIVGLSTDHIVARGNTITGSVGVIWQWAEFGQLLDKLGVKFNEIKSGPLKANPSPFQPINPEGRRVAEEMVADSQAWFLKLVKTRRKLDTASVPGLEEGRVYTGRTALRFKLIDQIGGQAEALAYLREKRDVPASAKLVDWKPRRPGGLGLAARMGAYTRAFLQGLLGENALPMGGLNSIVGAPSGLSDKRLDALKSVWQR
ncbi:MAG: signal peptide peptidase SppA [Pseudomonadota bacterium]